MYDKFVEIYMSSRMDDDCSVETAAKDLGITVDEYAADYTGSYMRFRAKRADLFAREMLKLMPTIHYIPTLLTTLLANNVTGQSVVHVYAQAELLSKKLVEALRNET